MIAWIVAAFLWTICMFVAGRGYERSLVLKKPDDPTFLPYKKGDFGFTGPEGPRGPMGNPGPEGLPGKDGEGYDEEKWQFDRRISNLSDRVNDLENRDAAYQDRFRRVEKKAGMNV